MYVMHVSFVLLHMLAVQCSTILTCTRSHCATINSFWTWFMYCTFTGMTLMSVSSPAGIVAASHPTCCDFTADEVFGQHDTAVATPDQFSKLNESAKLLLRLVKAQLHRQPRSVEYSVHLLPALGKQVFLEYSTQLKLEGRPDYAAYAELLPASFTPGSNEADSAAAAAKGSGAVQGNGSDSPSPRMPDAAANHIKPRDYDAVLTKLANSGLYKVPVQQLCQEHWPTPNSADWQQTQTMVFQLTTVLDWMSSQVQHPKQAQHDSKELRGTITQLLHHLLLGHLMDMALDLRKVFCTSFKVVIRVWQWMESNWVESHTNHSSASIGFQSSMPEGGLGAQLGRAFLRRFTADKALAEHLFKDAHQHPDPWEQEYACSVGTFLTVNCVIRESQAIGLRCDAMMWSCVLCTNCYIVIANISLCTIMMTCLVNTGCDQVHLCIWRRFAVACCCRLPTDADGAYKPSGCLPPRLAAPVGSSVHSISAAQHFG